MSEIFNNISFNNRNSEISVLETDRPDPQMTEAEIKYVPEQM